MVFWLPLPCVRSFGQSLDANFPGFGVSQRLGETGSQGWAAWRNSERAEFVAEKLGIGNQKEVCDRKNYTVNSTVANPTVAVAWEAWMVTTSFQASAGVKARKRGRKGSMFSRCMKCGSSTVGGSGLPQCWLLLFLVSWTLRTLAAMWFLKSDQRWGHTCLKFGCHLDCKEGLV